MLDPKLSENEGYVSVSSWGMFYDFSYPEKLRKENEEYCANLAIPDGWESKTLMETLFGFKSF